MPEYYYTARTEDGNLVKDRIRMKDEKSLADHLKGKNLILTSAKESDKEKKGGLKKMMDSFGKIPLVEKIFFTQNLSIMIRTGFSLGQALKTLGVQTANKKFKGIIEDLSADVDNGVTLSRALEKHSKIFSQIFINMIAAGEASGKLDEILVTLTTQMKKDHSIISKVKSAMTYPAIVLFAMIAIGVVMMVTIIPQLLEIFNETDLELPLATKILIFISDSMRNYGFYLAGMVVALIYGFFRLKKTKKGKFYLHKFLISAPLISNVIKKVNLARFTRTLSSLLKTDIPIVQTLQIISKTLGNVHYKNAMIDASEQVKKGVSIVKTLEKTPKLFPPIITQMISVGEESGTLDTISEEIADFYEADVDETMNNLSSIVEPILMLVMGAAVAVMALAILQPMYGLVDAV